MARLLLVEDDDDIRELVAELLATDGHEVSVARDGEEGLQRLWQGTPPDVLLLDVEMPNLDGPGMVRRMVEDGRGWEKIPIVLLSGTADLRLVARRLGTPYFLEKPTDHTELAKAVDLALRDRAAPLHRLEG